MLGCNVDVFGITSKLKEHIDLIQLRKRRVFWSASSMPTQLASTVVRRNEWGTHDCIMLAAAKVQ
eukprot:scaffold13659_cov75-Skeletonema_dohrnii-CCMP3373.AAC.1